MNQTIIYLCNQIKTEIDAFETRAFVEAREKYTLLRGQLDVFRETIEEIANTSILTQETMATLESIRNDIKIATEELNNREVTPATQPANTAANDDETLAILKELEQASEMEMAFPTENINEDAIDDILGTAGTTAQLNDDEAIDKYLTETSAIPLQPITEELAGDAFRLN